MRHFLRHLLAVVAALLVDASLALAAFRAGKIVKSRPFEPKLDPKDWLLTSPQAVEALLSQSDDATRLSDDRWAITTRIDFPGMVARSQSTVAVSASDDGLQMDVLDTTTVAESGPALARKLMEFISAKVRTSSRSVVSIEVEGATSRFVSDISMCVEMDLPMWLPIPKDRLEAEGSKSIQDSLDQQMEPIMAELRARYVDSALSAATER